MSTNLFSTYKTGENRITASILAVLGSLALGRVERLLGALMEQPELELVRFRNQPSRGAAGVPDAEIWSSCRILIETKVERGGLRADQLKRHLERLDRVNEATKCLLVMTPDETRPPLLDKIGDQRLTWASFASLNQAIDELLADKTEVVSEREAFLLLELKAMVIAEKLTGFQKDTVVVAARQAWKEYQNGYAYVCQPGRAFQTVKYMAFYTDGKILPLVPRVLASQDFVLFDKRHAAGLVGDTVVRFLELGVRREGDTHKVFVLSPPEDPQTVHLDGPIPNDLGYAFTQGQRYVSVMDLRKAKCTSDLVKAESNP